MVKWQLLRGCPMPNIWGVGRAWKACCWRAWLNYTLCGWHKLRTKNTVGFYRCKFECTEIPWREAHCRRHHLLFQHDNARPHVVRICTQFLEAENVLVLPWPACSPEMPHIEHVWDALDQHAQYIVPVPANIHQLLTAIEEMLDNIPQATINSLINSIRRRCATVHEANCDHTRYWLVFWTTPLSFFFSICH